MTARCSTIRRRCWFVSIALLGLLAGSLAAQETVKLLTTPKPDLGSPEYGYGFGIAEGGESVGHTGGFPGISSVLDIYLDGTTVAVLSNYDRGAPPVRSRIRQTLPAG